MRSTHITVGVTENRSPARDLTAQLGIADKVRFVGHVSHERMPAYYRHADVLLHTSLYESQAMAVVEALACGVLVVGRPVGIIHDLAGKACVATAGDAKEIAEALLRVVGDNNATARFRTEGLIWSRQNSLQATMERFLRLYQEINDEQ